MRMYIVTEQSKLKLAAMFYIITSARACDFSLLCLYAFLIVIAPVNQGADQLNTKLNTYLQF